MNHLEYMFYKGFFNTRAPFFMDMVTLIVSLLPLLVATAIWFARKKQYKTHIFSQIFIFVFSVVVLTYFEYGVRVGGGFNSFMKDSGVSHSYASVVLVFHIAISLITLILWAITIFASKKMLQLKKHKKIGLATFTGVVFTSLTGVWVYFLMFVY